MRDTVILISSQFLGKGEGELGEALLENYFTLLKQNQEKPAAVFFVNSGVLALTEQSLASLHIKELSEQEVPILACKTCVGYYDVESELVTGEISTMKHFIELSSNYRIISL